MSPCCPRHPGSGSVEERAHPPRHRPTDTLHDLHSGGAYPVAVVCHVPHHRFLEQLRGRISRGNLPRVKVTMRLRLPAGASSRCGSGRRRPAAHPGRLSMRGRSVVNRAGMQRRRGASALSLRGFRRRLRRRDKRSALAWARFPHSPLGAGTGVASAVAAKAEVEHYRTQGEPHRDRDPDGRIVQEPWSGLRAAHVLAWTACNSSTVPRQPGANVVMPQSRQRNVTVSVVSGRRAIEPPCEY